MPGSSFSRNKTIPADVRSDLFLRVFITATDPERKSPLICKLSPVGNTNPRPWTGRGNHPTRPGPSQSLQSFGESPPGSCSQITAPPWAHLMSPCSGTYRRRPVSDLASQPPPPVPVTQTRPLQWVTQLPYPTRPSLSHHPALEATLSAWGLLDPHRSAPRPQQCLRDAGPPCHGAVGPSRCLHTVTPGSWRLPSPCRGWAGSEPCPVCAL